MLWSFERFLLKLLELEMKSRPGPAFRVLNKHPPTFRQPQDYEKGAGGSTSVSRFIIAWEGCTAHPGNVGVGCSNWRVTLASIHDMNCALGRPIKGLKTVSGMTEDFYNIQEPTYRLHCALRGRRCAVCQISQKETFQGGARGGHGQI